MVDKTGEPILLSMAPFIDDGLLGPDRLLALAAPAAQEALAPWLESGLPRNGAPVPIFLGIAESHLDAYQAGGQQLVPQLEAALSVTFSRKDRFVLPLGHASGLIGLNHASRLIASGQADTALVGGVDSYYDYDRLAWLDERKRLHSEENRDGFIPGEGAGFCLLASMDVVRRSHLRGLATVALTAIEDEPYPFYSDGICIGTGLTRVFHRTLAALENDSAADWTICDMNGESFRGTEWVYAYLRTGAKHGDPLEIWHPADCYGDIGAASGPVQVGLGISAWERNYARGMRCLVWTSSDNAPCAAALLQVLN